MKKKATEKVNKETADTPKWEKHVKGRAGSKYYEICVLLDDNLIGKRSYGWGGKDKIIISSGNGETADGGLPEIVWEKVSIVADQIAEALNSMDKKEIENVLSQAAQMAEEA
jgi:hypothetical protein